MGTTIGQTGQGGRRARIGDDLGAYDVLHIDPETTRRRPSTGRRLGEEVGDGGGWIPVILTISIPSCK